VAKKKRLVLRAFVYFVALMALVVFGMALSTVLNGFIKENALLIIILTGTLLLMFVLIGTLSIAKVKKIVGLK